MQQKVTVYFCIAKIVTFDDKSSIFILLWGSEKCICRETMITFDQLVALYNTSHVRTGIVM